MRLNDDIIRTQALGDTREMIQLLHDQSGAVAAIVSAPSAERAKLIPSEARLISPIGFPHCAAVQALRPHPTFRPILGNNSALIDFLTPQMAFEPIQPLRVRSLNARKASLADEIAAQGAVRQVHAHLGARLREAREARTTAVMLVRAQLAGDPDSQDRRLSKTLTYVTGSFGIVVHDHNVIARSGRPSFSAYAPISPKADTSGPTMPFAAINTRTRRRGSVPTSLASGDTHMACARRKHLFIARNNRQYFVAPAGIGARRCDYIIRLCQRADRRRSAI